jgi:ribosomal protein S18 acetylase RimI-like enzyme
VIANEILSVEMPDHLAQARELFLEYGRSIRDHICLEGFQNEVDQLPGIYAPPSGRLLLARVQGQPAGCVALKRAGEGIGELKRLYVRPAFRGTGLGRRLTERALSEALQIGYRTIRLDTLPSMTEAQALYRSLGFESPAHARPAQTAGTPIDLELRFT